MAMTINTNLASLNAQTNLNTSQSSMTTSLQRLSSGLRINSAKDDAAGLSISERMTSQIRGLDQAARNASDAISLTQTAEGNLSQISSVLQRMREIAVQSASDSNTATDRTSLQSEATSLSAEIDRIANTAQFNGKNLLDGSFGSATFQVGANAGQTLAVSINGSTTTTLGLSGIATSTGTVTGTAALTNAGAMTILTTVGGTATTIAAGIDDGVSYVAGARAGTTSALALANAINAKTADTSVTATAKTEVTSAAVTTTSALSSGDLYINGTSIGSIAASTTVADRVAALVNAINGVSGTTGVTAASSTSTTYKLTAADGRNIDIASNLATANAATAGSGFTVSAAVAGVGGTTVSNYGQVTMTSGKAIDVGGTAVNGLADSALVGTTLSISTQSNASAAIASLDTAINTVNTQRSTMGIAQTRLDSVISNLRTSSDNVGAARGRIRDTDFAKETASMTRNQVLQQAGVAMLAQANALPNLVLSLLK
jgi:flagellin